MKSLRKQLREAQPMWGTRPLSLDPEQLCMTMLEGMPVVIPYQAFTPLVGFSRKSALYLPFTQLLQEVCDRGRAGGVAQAVLTYSRCLLVEARPPLVTQQRQALTTVGDLLELGHPREWFEEPVHLGRTLLHQLIEMPNHHLLVMVSPVQVGEMTGHLLGLAYVDGNKQLELYAA